MYPRNFLVLLARANAVSCFREGRDEVAQAGAYTFFRGEVARWLACALLLLIFIASPSRRIRAQSTEQQLAEHFRAGQQALRKGDFAQAAGEFKEVLAIDPTLVEAQVNLGLAYHSLSEYGLAVRYLTKALQARPNLLAPNVIVGMDYVKLNSPEKALPFLQRALKQDPSNPEAHQALVSCYLRQENFRGAAQEFRELAGSDPDKPGALFRLGHQYLDLAARLAYRGARLYPDSAWGHRFLGDLLFERSRWHDAAAEYQKALAMEPKQLGLHTSIGQAQLRSGDLGEAAAEFHRELQLDPASVTAWLGLAEIALKQTQPRNALEDVSKAWDASPELMAMQRDFPETDLTRDLAKTAAGALESALESPSWHFLLAALYAASGEDPGAAQQLKAFQSDVAAWQHANLSRSAGQAACQSHHDSVCARYLHAQRTLTPVQRLLLGKIEFALRQYDPAAEALSAATSSAKEGAEASYWLSRTYQALGTEAYSQLEESFPDSWRTCQLRGESAAFRKDYDEAAKQFRLAVQTEPQSPELHEALGELFLDTHSDAEAQSELERAISLDPSRTRALYLLGRLYVQNHENDKAIPYLQKAVRLEPDFSEANSLLGTAYVHMGRFADAIPSLQSAAPSDHYGNIHYQLYVAYKKLGQEELAKKSLARSQELRHSSLEHDQALIMGATHSDNE